MVRGKWTIHFTTVNSEGGCVLLVCFCHPCHHRNDNTVESRASTRTLATRTRRSTTTTTTTATTIITTTTASTNAPTNATRAYPVEDAIYGAYFSHSTTLPSTKVAILPPTPLPTHANYAIDHRLAKTQQLGCTCLQCLDANYSAYR
jgi:hypothetical protein